MGKFAAPAAVAAGEGESEGKGKPESEPAGGWLALWFGCGCREFWECGGFGIVAPAAGAAGAERERTTPRLRLRRSLGCFVMGGVES
jgi:hypothetical protein